MASITRFRIFAWSLVGAFLGFLLGVFLTETGQGGPRVMLMTMGIGWVVSFVLPFAILKIAGGAGSSLFAPSGKSTPHAREYSQAETYVARGQYENAIAAFSAGIAADGRDPTPYIRVARLQRDRLRDDRQAAHWFKKALTEPNMSMKQRMLTYRELIELYEVRMGAPEKAAPLLARFAEQSVGTPEGEWAADELARIKALMPGERGPT